MFKISEQLNELFSSLAKAQKVIENATKKSINPHYRSKYADLSEVLNVIREPLASNGLSFIQTVEEENENYFLLTILGHESGQFIITKLKLLMGKDDMQGLGSAITYARRYILSSLIGISQEDDDGRAAAESKKRDDEEKQKLKRNFEINAAKFIIPEDKNIDLVNKYIAEVAQMSNKSPEEIKERAQGNLIEFWNHYHNWIDKKTKF